MVNDSLGPEVIANIGCWGGGSGTSTELHVYAGHTADAQRLGSIIEVQVLQFAVDAGPDGDGWFVTRGWDWAPGDPDWWPSIRRTYDTRWNGDDWEEAVLDEWAEPQPN